MSEEALSPPAARSRGDYHEPARRPLHRPLPTPVATFSPISRV
ncbi:hypothetical protein PAHAL_7G136800 [Panicum hallii]|uniref:Uncharacterized protein n=1 Tax=Panicum hallii TaxID=206008 RepID=A0A2T8IC85_9POAL|nr:hypothetical protein PAHAL_7G136800 [Panicum hallii]